MLHSNKLVALLPRIDKRHVQADFQLLRNHKIILNLFNTTYCPVLPKPQRIKSILHFPGIIFLPYHTSTDADARGHTPPPDPPWRWPRLSDRCRTYHALPYV